MTEEEKYIYRRIWKAKIQSIPFYLCRLFPIRKNKIVFTCIEGTTGYTCNPKYIAKEILRQKNDVDFELIWLVDDMSKRFPKGIRKVKNTLWNRAFHLSTAGFWIDNSRKQLEVRKRCDQIYIQTWHAKLGFKPTCLDRGASFSKIAYLVSKHDSDMVDYWLSNSDWYDHTLLRGSLYRGNILRAGSPRCDLLVRAKKSTKYKTKLKKEICRSFQIDAGDIQNIHFLMYAPTFRGGSQDTNRTIEVGSHFPDYQKLRSALSKRFGGTWYIALRLHPQLVARQMEVGLRGEGLIDVSKVDDMYPVLAGCDAFLTDYSSAAFDASVMRIPVFLFADDYKDYEKERGALLWDLHKLPFPLAENDRQLQEQILGFDKEEYQEKLDKLFEETGMVEDGRAAERVVCFLVENNTRTGK